MCIYTHAHAHTHKYSTCEADEGEVRLHLLEPLGVTQARVVDGQLLVQHRVRQAPQSQLARGVLVLDELDDLLAERVRQRYRRAVSIAYLPQG